MASYRFNVKTEPDLGLVARFNRVLPWMIGMAVIVLVLSRYLPQFHKNEDLRRQLQEKTELADRLEAEVNRLRMENSLLARDPRTIERTVREQLSYARADERVVTFQDATAVMPALRRVPEIDATRPNTLRDPARNR